MILSHARKSLLLNQWVFGKHLGVSQAKVSMIERGQVCLSEAEKKRIAKILQMPVDSIEWPAPYNMEEQGECQAGGIR